MWERLIKSLNFGVSTEFLFLTVKFKKLSSNYVFIYTFFDIGLSSYHEKNNLEQYLLIKCRYEEQQIKNVNKKWSIKEIF